MNVETISFNKIGHDQFIDFLKAYAIIFVVVAHNFPASWWNYCLFHVWGDMQVPIFILVQSFHAYKKNVPPIIKWKSIVRRIIIPFAVIQGVVLVFNMCFSVLPPNTILKTFVLEGGLGPGSYYFWVYIQMTFLLVIIWPLIQKLSRQQLIWLFLFFSVGCEVLFSLIHLPDALYRLLAVRYLFLVPLALRWIDEGVILNTGNVILSLFSILAVIFFSFCSINLEPVFYYTGWATHRWVCYFYIPSLLTYALWLVYKWMCKYNTLSSVFRELARCSYEIFLFQMLVFAVLPYSRFDFIPYSIIRFPLWMLLTFFASIFGGIVINKTTQRFFLS